MQPPIAVRKTPVVIPSRISKKMAKKGRRSIVMDSEDEDYERFVLRFLGSQVGRCTDGWPALVTST